MASSPLSELSARNQKNYVNRACFGLSVTSRPIAVSSEIEAAEGIVAAELNGLSIKERDSASDDFNCVGQGQEDDPEMICNALEKFEEEVRKANHPVYKLAVMKKNPNVQDSEYRLRFLRGALFDVKKAARQMLSLLQYQAEYFAIDALDRKIALSDLKEEEVKLMLKGLCHFSTQTDRNGRYVAYCLSNVFLADIPAEAMIRACMYASQEYGSFPDLDKRGLVAVYMDVGGLDQSMQLGPRHFNWVFNMIKFYLALPFTLSSMHYCVNIADSNSVAIRRNMIGSFMKALPRYATVRTKFHYGSALEIRYSLQSHGIPLGTYPIDSNGQIRQEMIDSSCLKHYGIDAFKYRGKSDSFIKSNDTAIAMTPVPPTPTSSQQTRAGHSVLVEPKHTDVLLGRGKPIQNHPGNIHLRSMIEESQEQYDAIGRLEKRQMIQNIRHACHARGTRFLKQHGKKTWVLADSAEADEKIRQHFRCCRRKR
ncbi:unnamed protein product [Cylindrotheca closterium]|uniref:DUF6824 domain-containing protein n=1 Tax=Cylindrotheca closterium TaxID=2856 RepID=A0AAD2GBG8_9STRA|nr:unnamed protein product [Cylindrotheca closterium]